MPTSIDGADALRISEPPTAENGTTDRDPTLVQGVLELHPRGYGFLRDPDRNFRPLAEDAFVDAVMVARYRLAPGWRIAGPADPPRKGFGPRLAAITEIEGQPPQDVLGRLSLEESVAVDPTLLLRLETAPEIAGPRVIDLLCPIGKGQRGLIVAPPRSGKTMLLHQIARALETNHPEVHQIMLLIDERPEEVTEMRRTVRGQVFASSSDKTIEEHIRLAELVVERARRLAEIGRHVVLLLDSLTRLARAYNKGVNTGRTMSGGVDIRALEVPKRLFGAARAIEGGGSLTVLGTVLVDTGSRMDDLIFQEFKGTGNMELVLDRRMAERRIWPAIDLSASGTRKEEKLLDPETLRRVVLLRRTLSAMKPAEAMEALVKRLNESPNNAAFLDRIGRVNTAKS